MDSGGSFDQSYGRCVRLLHYEDIIAKLSRLKMGKMLRASTTRRIHRQARPMLALARAPFCASPAGASLVRKGERNSPSVVRRGLANHQGARNQNIHQRAGGWGSQPEVLGQPCQARTWAAVEICQAA
jgi:hypothetical protein